MRFIFLSLVALAVGLSCRAAEDGTLLPTGGFRIRDPFVLAENGTYYLYEAKPWSGGRGVNGPIGLSLRNTHTPRGWGSPPL